MADTTAEKVRELIARLRTKEPHHECEDCWYSCSQAEDCCDERRRGDPCDCGADSRNAQRREAADLIETLWQVLWSTGKR